MVVLIYYLKILENNPYFQRVNEWDYERIRKYDETTEKILFIEVDTPSTEKTVAQYHTENCCIYNEKCFHLMNLITIYENAITLNLPLEVSFGNMSIVLLRKTDSPYPQLALSPYAYLLALKEKHINKKRSLYS